MTWDGSVPVHVVAGKTAYLEVPKAGCTSVKHALLLARGDTPPKDIDDIHRWMGYMHARNSGEVVDWFKHRWPKWFKFTVVRDPIARFESFYYGLSAHERGAYGDISRYVMEEFTSDPWHLNIHAIPQTHLLGDDLSVFDFVGRTENMVEVEDTLRRFVDNRCRVPRLNVSVRGPSVSAPARKRLRRLFARDFEVLGYA